MLLYNMGPSLQRGAGAAANSETTSMQKLAGCKPARKSFESIVFSQPPGIAADCQGHSAGDPMCFCSRLRKVEGHQALHAYPPLLHVDVSAWGVRLERVAVPDFAAALPERRTRRKRDEELHPAGQCPPCAAG